MNIRHQDGVTLMELMVVMVVVAILAAIAFPSYRQQVMRTARSDGKVALEQTAANLERCFTRLNRYDDAANCPIANTLGGGGFPTASGTYAITGAVTATTYALTATPQAGQAGDRCGNFTLDQTNARGVSGGPSANDCWNR